MTTALEHYENHLGPVYSWMVGDVEAALARGTRENGQWQQRVSSYPKLRLHPDQVAATLIGLGLVVSRGAGPAGMVRIAATKP
jgi:hypothetical protein